MIRKSGCIISIKLLATLFLQPQRRVIFQKERYTLTEIEKSEDKAKAENAHSEDLETNGFCVVEDVLSPGEVFEIRQKLMDAVRESNRRGVPTYIPSLDQNDSNIRVFNLLDLDPVFIKLMERPEAIAFVKHLIGEETSSLMKPS